MKSAKFFLIRLQFTAFHPVMQIQPHTGGPFQVVDDTKQLPLGFHLGE
jgi:hypothetical protein